MGGQNVDQSQYELGTVFRIIGYLVGSVFKSRGDVRSLSRIRWYNREMMIFRINNSALEFYQLNDLDKYFHMLWLTQKKLLQELFLL